MQLGMSFRLLKFAQAVAADLQLKYRQPPMLLVLLAFVCYYIVIVSGKEPMNNKTHGPLS